MPQGQPRDKSLFENTDLFEIYRYINVKMKLKSTHYDPEHPTRPKIKFIGTVSGVDTMAGEVWMTSEGEVHWHFVSLTLVVLLLEIIISPSVCCRNLAKTIIACGGSRPIRLS